MKRLDGWDAMLLYSETPNTHMHTLKIAVIDAAHIDGEYGFEQFLRTVRRRMPLLEPLRYQLVDIPLKLHHPMWRENVDVDLDYHVRRVQAPSPGGRRELDQVIGEIASTPLDRRRPLWELYFVEGLADNRFAGVCKVHHALADGVASANLLALAMDTPLSDDEDHDYPADPDPSTGQLLVAAARDHARQISRLPTLIKHTAGGISRVRRSAKERDAHPAFARTFHPPDTFINHIVSPVRTFATATLALADIKETKNELGLTINELVLSISAGALRVLRMRYDGSSDEPIITSVAASTDTSTERITGNKLSGMFVSLPVQVPDPLERVRLTKMSAGIAKDNYNLLGPTLLGEWTSFMPPALAPMGFRRIAKRQAKNKLFNIPISNVPGPRQRGAIDGVPISEIYSVGPVMAGSGINITVWSYVDQLNISVLADDQTTRDPHEVTDAMVNEFIEIRTAAGLSAALTKVATAMAPAAAIRATGTNG